MPYGGREAAATNCGVLGISYSDVQGGEAGVFRDSELYFTWSPGSIDSDPSFCDPAIVDYHVGTGSPVIDMGNNTAVESSVDLDGNARIMDGDVDMGAYEFPGVDCSGNGIAVECPCPAGTITEADPLDTTIDARQPHPIDDNSLVVRQGIGREAITITLDVAEADAMTCWELCETRIEELDPAYPQPALEANQIVSVTDLGSNMYKLFLERPISAGHWTTITYTGDGSYVSYASLPADADADQTSSPPDILRHIDCCLSQICTPPYGDYSCDIDHSGSVNSSELMRLIDLLNGAWTYIAWNNESLPDNTCPGERGAMAMSSGPSISPDNANAVFIDGFVDYLTSVTLSDREAAADFELIADGLASFSLEWLSLRELDLLSEAMLDPSLSYTSPIAAAKAWEIVIALAR